MKLFRFTTANLFKICFVYFFQSRNFYIVEKDIWGKRILEGLISFRFIFFLTFLFLYIWFHFQFVWMMRLFGINLFWKEQETIFTPPLKISTIRNEGLWNSCMLNHICVFIPFSQKYIDLLRGTAPQPILRPCIFLKKVQNISDR